MAAKDLDGSDIKKQEELEDITTCCICTEVYTDPKALPCIHTFCMKCLQENGLKNNKGPGDEMPCPICRRLFKIPPEGFPGLPKHFFIERLIQVSRVSHPPVVSRALCSVCLEESRELEGKETPEAETYCVECKHQLCDACCTEHRKFKATKNHKLISLNEHSGDQNVMTYLPPGTCEVHEQKVLDVFCADCKTVVCAICFNEDHNNHKGSQVNKYLGAFRKEIQNNTEAINECISQAQMKRAELVKVKEQMQQRVESLESDVEKRRNEIKQFADEHANRLLQSLCSERQSRLKQIHVATDDIDAYLSNLESYNSYCKRIMAKGSASDICNALSDLSLRATELRQQCQPIIEGGIQDFKLCFRQFELEEFLKVDCSNLTGVIEASGAGKSDGWNQNAGASVQDSGVTRYVLDKLEDELAEAKQEILRLHNQLRLQSSSSFDESFMDQSVMTQFITGHSFAPPSDAPDHINSLGHPDPVHSQQDYDKLKEKLMHLSITGRRLDIAMQHVNIYSCHDGDVTLFVWNSDLGHYLAYLTTHGPDHFLHADCVGIIDSLDSDLKEAGKWIIAEVVSRDFCLAKKVNNRFRVPIGTKFYRVKIKPWSPGHSSPKTLVAGDYRLKHTSVPDENPDENPSEERYYLSGNSSSYDWSD